MLPLSPSSWLSGTGSEPQGLPTGRSSAREQAIFGCNAVHCRGSERFWKGGCALLVAIYFFGYLLRVSTPQGYSLKVRQHQSSSLLALYLRNPKMKLPKRFNRAEQHLFAKQTVRVQFKRGTVVYQQEAGRRKTLGKGNFKLQLRRWSELNKLQVGCLLWFWVSSPSPKIYTYVHVYIYFCIYVHPRGLLPLSEFAKTLFVTFRFCRAIIVIFLGIWSQMYLKYNLLKYKVSLFFPFLF